MAPLLAWARELSVWCPAPARGPARRAPGIPPRSTADAASLTAWYSQDPRPTFRFLHLGRGLGRVKDQKAGGWEGCQATPTGDPGTPERKWSDSASGSQLFLSLGHGLRVLTSSVCCTSGWTQPGPSDGRAPEASLPSAGPAVTAQPSECTAPATPSACVLCPPSRAGLPPPAKHLWMGSLIYSTWTKRDPARCGERAPPLSWDPLGHMRVFPKPWSDCPVTL